MTARLALAAAAAALAAAQDPFNCTTQPAAAWVPHTLTNKRGTQLTFLPYGATLQSVLFADCGGVARDIILGFDQPSSYCDYNGQHPYFGAGIGRYANRIGNNGTFTLNGTTHHLPLNDNGYDTLHGGTIGFDRRVWSVASYDPARSVVFGYISPDGEMGFPGQVSVQVTYTLTDDDEWQIDWAATAAAGGNATIINLSQHTYWNLNGFTLPDVLEHELAMPTGDRFLGVDAHLIPTGDIDAVVDYPWMDFTTGKPVGRDIANGTVAPGGGYDNAFVFRGWAPSTPPVPVVSVFSPATGIALSMSTDQPSVQFYSANMLNGSIPRKRSQGGPGVGYGHWSAVVLEAQGLVDAINNPEWWSLGYPSSILAPGATYTQHTRYALTRNCSTWAA